MKRMTTSGPRIVQASFALLLVLVGMPEFVFACLGRTTPVKVSGASFNDGIAINISGACGGNVTISPSHLRNAEQEGRQLYIPGERRDSRVCVDFTSNEANHTEMNSCQNANFAGPLHEAQVKALTNRDGRQVGIFETSQDGKAAFLYSVNGQGEKDPNQPYIRFSSDSNTRILHVDTFVNGRQAGHLIAAKDATCPRSLSSDAADSPIDLHGRTLSPSPDTGSCNTQYSSGLFVPSTAAVESIAAAEGGAVAPGVVPDAPARTNSTTTAVDKFGLPVTSAQ